MHANDVPGTGQHLHVALPLAIARPDGIEVEDIGAVDDVHALAEVLGAPALLESGGSDRETMHLIMLAPRGILRASSSGTTLEWAGVTHPIAAGFLDTLRALARATSVELTKGTPVPGGFALLLGYDLAREIEDIPAHGEDRDSWPRALALACPAVITVDARTHHARLAWLRAGTGPGATWGLSAREAAALLLRARETVRQGLASSLVGGPVGAVREMWTPEDHARALATINTHLHAGNLYQANVAMRFEVGWQGSVLPLHGVLRRTNPSPMSGWWRAGGCELVSSSPERLVRLQGRALITEPMGGTLPVEPGASTAAVELASERLRKSAKDSAEHVMIVDIHRNDLGRVSAPASVRVESMMRIDRRSHVVQAVADIRAILAEDRDAIDVIAAMFPGGCITGVPKVRCMQILAEVEPFARGPYTGSLGYLSAAGDLDLNVLIRTAWRFPGGLALAAGGGIVLGSNPAAEHAEALAKAAALREAIEELGAQ